MIKSDEGITAMVGTEDDILTDFGCIVLSLIKLMHKHGYTKEQIRDKLAGLVSFSYSRAMQDIDKKEGE